MRPAPTPSPVTACRSCRCNIVSAQTLLKLMDSFATKAGTVRADATRNLLLIQGTGAERRTAVDTALSFDVDWMRGQSVGIFPISSGLRRRSSRSWKRSWIPARTVSARTWSSSSRSPASTPSWSSPSKPEMLRTAATWIKRLDHADTARTTVHVYRVKYGEARQIARVLTEMFIGGSGSSNLLDSADNQVAPGSGSSTASSADRLSLSANNPASASGFRQRGGTHGKQHAVGRGHLGSRRTRPPGGSGHARQRTRRTSGNGQPMLQDVRITPDIVNNTLLIYADQANYRIIEATLLQIDQPQLQVAIDATIAEVTLNNTLSLRRPVLPHQPEPRLAAEPGSILNTQATQRSGERRRSQYGRGLRCRVRHQRLHQPRLSGLQFPDRFGDAAELHSRCAACRHQRQGAVEPFAGRDQQPGGDTAGRRRRAGFDRQRHRADDATTPWSTPSTIATPASSCASRRASASTATVRLDVEQEISNVPQTSAATA